MAIAIVGDVHGCINEVRSLIKKVTDHGVEEIIFVGDLIDKGPYSVEVLRFVKDLDDEMKISIVEGNHENKHFRFWSKMESGYTDQALKMKGADDLKRIMTSAGRPLRCWIKNKTVPYITRPKLGLTVVHGGITPSIPELPEDYNNLSGRQKKRVLRSMYVRHITREEGNMIPFGQERPQDPFWAEVYDGRFGHIVFGHQAWLSGEPKKFPHATGVDLGCVYGGHLCALVMEGNNKEVITIPAKEKYCEEVQEVTY